MTIFCFLDVETTGLSPVDNYVLEVAWVLTDAHFNQLSAPQTFIVNHDQASADVAAQIRASSFITNMHSESGLLRELANPQVDSVPMDEILNAFEQDVLTYRSDENGPTDNAVRLAGYSVSFDREFLRANGWWDIFETRKRAFQMHHRILDLSSNIQLFEAAGRTVPFTYNENPHRALDDALDALELAQLMRDELAMF